MYCPNCGTNVGDANFCPNCGQKVKAEEPQEKAVDVKPQNIVSHDEVKKQAPEKPKKKHGCLITVLVVLVIFSIFIGIGVNSSNEVTSIYSAYIEIDDDQISDENYEAVASFMDDYLEERGYFPLDYTVEWIGYYKYTDAYTFEDWKSMELGGYYSYSANLSTGEMANGRVQCYWGEGETPTIVNLNIETATSENPIVEYSDEAISACFGVYTQKAEALLAQ